MSDFGEAGSRDPVLAYSIFSHPLILEVDASHGGLGAVLSHEQEIKGVAKCVCEQMFEAGSVESNKF